MKGSEYSARHLGAACSPQLQGLHPIARHTLNNFAFGLLPQKDTVLSFILRPLPFQKYHLLERWAEGTETWGLEALSRTQTQALPLTS